MEKYKLHKRYLMEFTLMIFRMLLGLLILFFVLKYYQTSRINKNITDTTTGVIINKTPNIRPGSRFGDQPSYLYDIVYMVDSKEYIKKNLNIEPGLYHVNDTLTVTYEKSNPQVYWIKGERNFSFYGFVFFLIVGAALFISSPFIFRYETDIYKYNLGDLFSYFLFKLKILN
jgi:hypothetical protein